MRNYRYILVISVFLLLLCGLSFAEEVLLCPGCGWERAKADKVCSHCKEDLPKIEVSVESNEIDQDVSSDDSYIGEGVVSEEVKLARKHVKKKDYAVAYLFYENAFALEMLTDPSGERKRANVIASEKRKCEKYLKSVTKECRLCKGTGKKILKRQTFDGKKAKIVSSLTPCKLCGGLGKRQKPATADERKLNMGRALSRYIITQQKRKYVPLGNAWIPFDLENEISIKQKALLKRTIASSCESCAGIGYIDCRKCGGEGVDDCSKCRNGRVKVDNPKDEQRRLGQIFKDGTKQCEDCDGHGNERCDSCSGKGGVICRKCNGSGEKPVCDKCSGRGLNSCKRCKGSGEYKNTVCVNCKGEKFEECSSCKGEGRD